MDTPRSLISRDPIEDEPDTMTPDRRFLAIAAVLARGLLRTLDSPSSDPSFSAGRISPNPAFSDGSEVALPPETSVTVPTG
jgi:hypothetical protein